MFIICTFTHSVRLLLVTEFFFSVILLLALTSCVSRVVRLREPVCVGAGSQQVGGGGTTRDGVSALQQVQTSTGTTSYQFK